MTLEAVLWDMDGTLVDTEPYWIECEFALADRYQREWSHQHALNIVGLDLLDAANYIRTQLELVELTAEQIRDQLLEGVESLIRQHIPWRAGARELLDLVVLSGIPNALVTMSYRSFAQPVIDALPRGTFSAVVTGEVVSRGKPDPEPYLRAASLLGVDPTACLAIEDSPTGCQSAEAAGCTVLAIPNHVPVPPSANRYFRNSLEGLSVADLDGVLNRPLDSSHSGRPASFEP
ncbi:MAG TPA: HAD family phosphatase [Marmoricola sp.]|nr:HAD family phosphatase [Marmoricola sp.]